MAPPFKVLMDLRTALTGYSGISQETRLLFSTFQSFEAVAVHGLINRDLDFVSKALPADGRPLTPLMRYNRLSRFLLSLQAQPDMGFTEKVARYLMRRYDALWLGLRGRLNLAETLTEFDATAFGDTVWEKMFARSLPVQDWDSVVNAPYKALSAPYFSMHHAGLLPYANYPRLDTTGFDALLVPNPYPARPKPGTQLIVRYHDAIPMFYPQFIPDARFHQRSHASALHSNAKHGIFVCTTNAVRGNLLSLFPELEDRSTTIHDMVSHNYYPQDVEKRQICEIVRSRAFAETEPPFHTLRDKRVFYDRTLKPDTFDYLVYVSVIEPRKNHQRLLRAFELLLNRGFEHLKLVIVGYPGQAVERVLAGMQVLQRRGQVFHLVDVPSDELRALYAGAACTICPSIAEGFDLSGIEAMLSGSVVATSDIPVHREVYGDAAVYFNAYSIQEQANAIESLILADRGAFRQSMQAKGAAHAQQYSRDRIAAQWQSFFEKIARKKPAA